MKTYDTKEVTITIDGEEVTPTKVDDNKFIYKKLWEKCKNGKTYVVLREED